MTITGDAASFNRKHTFVYFHKMPEARVAELKIIVKKIAGYAVNRKRAIARPVEKAPADMVRLSLTAHAAAYK